MPAIPDEALDCVVYLYPDAEAADRGMRGGGSGCIVSLPKFEDGLSFAYIITNSHVIREGKSGVVRVNTRDGNTLSILSKAEHWHHHSSGDDLAALSINLEYDLANIKAIPDSWFITQEAIQKYRIGPGDDIFMPGRFVNHEGKQRNLPAVRFGNLSMLPHEPIRTGRGLLQECFLIECRSLPGYSGSPVFLFSMLPTPVRQAPPPPMLLGIDFGHIQDALPILNREELKQGRKVPIDKCWAVEANTGMSCVVPAWKIKELLFSDELINIRAETLKKINTPITPANDDKSK